MNWLLESWGFFWDEDAKGDLVPFEVCLRFLDPADNNLVGERNPWIVYGFLLSMKDIKIEKVVVDCLYILLINKTSII